MQRALLWEDAEQLGGILAHDLHQLLHGDPALVDALGQHDGQRGLHAQRAVAGLPDIGPALFLVFLGMAAVIGADGVDLTPGQLLPQDIRPRLFTGGRRKFHIGADLGAILLAESQVVGAGLTVDVVAFCLGLVDDVHRAGVAGVDDDQAAFGVAVEVDGSADGLVLLELGAGIQIRGDVFPALGLQVLLLDMDQRVVLGVDAEWWNPSP